MKKAKKVCLKVFEGVRSWGRKLSRRETALLLCFTFVLSCAVCVRNLRTVPGGTRTGFSTVGSGRRFCCFRSESMPSVARRMCRY